MTNPHTRQLPSTDDSVLSESPRLLIDSIGVRAENTDAPALGAAATQTIGLVLAVEGAALRVRSGTVEVDALRAASCLLEPGAGDEVLLVHHHRGCHVLAVLTRGSDAPSRLSLEGDVQIATPSGGLELCARDAVKLTTGGETTIQSGALRVAAKDANVTFDALRYVGGALSAEIDKVKTVAKSVESTAQRLVQRLDRAYRFIAKSEVVKAQYVQFDTQSAFHVKAETTVLTSASLTKVDGAQIHLG